ncbi:TM0106 family RecB-like putative nuclease [Candidatus Viadribacter manganicus]|uniref:Nuclease n=1 Tax=Candidatus Viadribacter manganicus TaxID=1759059 RepID=A0A1B1AHN2_9PROT|nr:TM0106 family RecB-like putative nuclease [Candidatus Viadribacter manganicus]ANP46072.1 nuclease [Candidatus Viadribacter manganicus]
MQKQADAYLLSATDLVGHLGCKRLTELNRALADDLLKKPASYPDPLLDALIERGRRHEAAYVDSLSASGKSVADLSALPTGVSDQGVEQTLQAMRAGVDFIIQGALKAGQWSGRPDILRRVDLPSGQSSAFGAYYYEALDAKLARETKAGAVLQLCLYSDLLDKAQGFAPQHAYVVSPGEPFTVAPFRVAAYAAYFRWVQQALTRKLASAPSDAYPDPVEQCEICRWYEHCDARRRLDDHLSFVAGAGKRQIAELIERERSTLAALAAMPLPLGWRPERGAKQTYERLREQARVQLEARTKDAPVFEVLPITPGQGLALLPEPSAGDIFLDLEGAGYVPPNGREFLFGYVYANDADKHDYRGVWAITPAQEQAAFEAFMDFVAERLQRYPDLHIYHYAPYEPSAFKRLAGRYATRASELDELLRSHCFVDLFAVVRQGVLCGLESYSIKKLERYYGFTRQAAMPDVNRSMPRVQAALELGQPLDELADDCEVVERYNEDDCRSTLVLRDWLEGLRADELARGVAIERPAPPPPEASEHIRERERAAAELAAQLHQGAPADPADRDQYGRWLLAQLLGFHRREERAVGSEYYRIAELSAEDLFDHKSAISGLQFEAVIEAGDKPVHRYRFPPQETDLQVGDTVRPVGGGYLGTIKAISAGEGVVDIKKQLDATELHPEAVFGFDTVPTKVLADALMRIGVDVLQNGFGASSSYPAARDLLTRTPPSSGGASLVQDSERTLDAAVHLGLTLPSGVLPIQGPPGTGKTYTGAAMIVALIKAGKKVGVTANSHPVILHLIEKALGEAGEAGLAVSCVHKGAKTAHAPDGVRFIGDNARAVKALGSAQLIGGTAWFWSREEVANKVDVLFVDEAAQMSLANVLAASHAAPTLVLLGDPRQLDQPTKSSHPDGTDVSALDHILAGEQTIAADQGLFLAETWRLHPAICAFTSELFYEGRLQPRPGLERQEIKSSGRLQGSGLRYLPVAHAGNVNVSHEEVDAICALVDDVLSSDTTWIDADGAEKPVTLDDILIIAPYNAQVFQLQQRLPGARVGTVDKAQGQEKPIVIYSLASSSSTETPRGMEFLYSLNRLNVASSRARCLCVLVAAPALFEAECRSPRQMELANAFCRYRELATVL